MSAFHVPDANRPLVHQPELWAGIECTVNRVGDCYNDQLKKNGHHERIGDLDLFAQLGVRALRYPVLWERVAPQGVPDWSWSDARLSRLRELEIRPIVGLLHHGSGPRDTSLIDPAFPDRFATYARACAERYPWVVDWSPVNEPLTTARFSGLYGLWYPHGTDEATFLRALVGQCRAVILAMQAIRQVIPSARLIQTEDLGKTWSTPALAYQAEFENHRRWLSIDLLSGRVDDRHPLRAFVVSHGIDPEVLDWFGAHPCPPDVLGINHYLTSERYLDERLDLFPPETHGGNGRDRYADVEAVRACALGGPKHVLQEAWDRFNIPLAVTEAHLHCTREEQLRWFYEIWTGCCELREAGVPLLAVTAWAGLGSYDWVSLLTRNDNVYEAGVFDLRGGSPRPTAIAHLIQTLGRGQQPTHPLLEVPGWWHRDVRILYETPSPVRHRSAPPGLQPLLITGRSGTLGRAFARACHLRGIPCLLTGRDELDIADPLSLASMLDRHQPWAVINTAGYVRVREAETDIERCWRENVVGPRQLALATAARHVPLVSFSSHLVFDGAQGRPYREGDAPSPLNVYGRSKAEAEQIMLTAHPGSLVIRTSSFFSADDDDTVISLGLRALGENRQWDVHDGVTISPTYVPHLVDAVLDILIDGERGIWHVVNDGAMTWLELAHRAAEAAGLRSTLITPRPVPTYLPTYTPLTSERAILLPRLDDALRSYQEELSRHQHAWRLSQDSSGRQSVQSARRSMHT